MEAHQVQLRMVSELLSSDANEVTPEMADHFYELMVSAKYDGPRVEPEDVPEMLVVGLFHVWKLLALHYDLDEMMSACLGDLPADILAGGLACCDDTNMRVVCPTHLTEDQMAELTRQLNGVEALVQDYEMDHRAQEYTGGLDD